MIDLEKEREAFEIYELSKYPKANKEILFARFKESDLGEDEKDFEGLYINEQIDERFTSWIELAKAKQVEIDSNQLLTEREKLLIRQIDDLLKSSRESELEKQVDELLDKVDLLGFLVTYLGLLSFALFVLFIAK